LSRGCFYIQQKVDSSKYTAGLVTTQRGL